MTAGTTPSSSPSDDENKPEEEQDKDNKSCQHKSKNDRKVSDLACQLKRHGNSDSSGGGFP